MLAALAAHLSPWAIGAPRSRALQGLRCFSRDYGLPPKAKHGFWQPPAALVFLQRSPANLEGAQHHRRTLDLWRWTLL